MRPLRLRVLPLVALALVVVSVFLAAWTTPPPVRQATPPRNVILISLDTLRADHLGAWGYERSTSPRLDELAGKSVVFRRAVAQGSSTIPSHASLFTSQYATAVLSDFGAMLGGSTTLAEILSGDGFATWGFVDGGNVRAHFGFDQGFDHYEDDRVGIAKLVRRAKQWIVNHPVDRFFLFLHTYDIHTPYKAPPAYVKHFGDPDYRGGFHPNTRYFRAVERSGEGLPEREHAEVVARYDAGILYTDERVGGFLDWLDQTGLLADSLVVITSDHGEEFLEHGRLGHQQVYLDPNLRVPLFFYRPGEASRVVEDTVELTDVVPTILELLGLSAPENVVGRSLVPYLEGRGLPARPAYAEKGGSAGEETIISERYQLILNRKTSDVSLFDLASDPDAEHDVAGAHPEVAARLAAELDRRRQRATLTRELNAEAGRVWKRPKPMREKVRKELEALGYLEP